MKIRLTFIYALLLTIFLEALNLSFYFMGVRIRASQLIEVVALVYLFIGLLSSRFKFKTTPIDTPLISYLVINIIAIANSPWSDRSIKITVLLFSLVALYYVIVNLLNSRKVFEKAVNFILVIGIMDMGYGIYQVIAGIVNVTTGLNLPIGHLGLVHGKYIGAPWGRPYGTFVEPDWYGTICMYFLLIFASVYYDAQRHGKRMFYMAGLFIAILGLFFSFVRAAWLGFFVGAGILVFYNISHRTLSINIVTIFKKALTVAMVTLILILTIPPLRNVIIERLNPTYDTNAQLTFENIRFKMMEISLNAMLDHPVLGNGPGSAGYNFLVNDHGKMQADEMIKSPNLLKGREGFDPSFITTILSDTGLLGLVLFIWLLYVIVSQNIRKIGKLESRYRSLALGLFAGFMALIASYVFTQGMWLPFTWVFLGLNMVVLKYTEAGNSLNTYGSAGK